MATPSPALSTSSSLLNYAYFSIRSLIYTCSLVPCAFILDVALLIACLYSSHVINYLETVVPLLNTFGGSLLPIRWSSKSCAWNLKPSKIWFKDMTLVFSSTSCLCLPISLPCSPTWIAHSLLTFCQSFVAWQGFILIHETISDCPGLPLLKPQALHTWPRHLADSHSHESGGVASSSHPQCWAQEGHKPSVNSTQLSLPSQ